MLFIAAQTLQVSLQLSRLKKTTNTVDTGTKVSDWYTTTYTASIMEYWGWFTTTYIILFGDYIDCSIIITIMEGTHITNLNFNKANFNMPDDHDQYDYFKEFFYVYLALIIIVLDFYLFVWTLPYIILNEYKQGVEYVFTLYWLKYLVNVQ